MNVQGKYILTSQTDTLIASNARTTGRRGKNIEIAFIGVAYLNENLNDRTIYGRIHFDNFHWEK